MVDLIKDRKRDDLFPVGRLDKDTEGLLIITNNGELAHRLLSPKKHVDKVYFAKVKGIVTEDDIECFAQGLDIGDEKPTLPAELVICSSDENIRDPADDPGGEIPSGETHVPGGRKGSRLPETLRMGPVTLDDSLKPGEYRRLTEEEVDRLCSQERSRNI